MENKNIIWIVSIIIVVALGAFGLRFVPVGNVKDPEVNEPRVQTPTTDLEQTDEVAEVEEDDDIAEVVAEQKSPRKPSIATTQYSVYIGFASKVGTSSEAVLGKEVGEAVVGYEWESLFPSPMFSTVVLPEWDTSETETKYSVFNWEDDAYALLGVFTSGEDVKFPRDGLRGATRFRIIGISPDLRICPGDRSLTWDVRFTFEGPLGFVRTPITQVLSQGETCRMR